MNELLGEYLKKEREARRVSIAEMSRAIHISPELISALEESRFKSFSQPEYLVGYTKLYSIHLGLDPLEMGDRIAREISLSPQKGGQPGAHPLLGYHSSLRHLRKNEEGELGHVGWTRKRGILSVLVVLLISLFFFLPGTYKGPATTNSHVTDKPSVPGDAASSTHHPLAPPVIPSPIPGPAPAPIVGESPPPAAVPETKRVVGNRDSRRYHLPGMKFYNGVQEYHRVIFHSEEEAVRAGYRKAPR